MTRTEDAAALVPAGWLTRMRRLPCEGGPSGAQWADTLPRLLAESLDGWGLSVAGPARTGWTAIVLPVTRDGEAAALKVVWPHAEAAAEGLALRHWGGTGAVELRAADPGRGALLLEALDPTRDLRDLWIDDACEVVGGLLAQLHRPAPPRLPRLSDHLRRQLDRIPHVADRLPRRMLERGAGLMRDALDDPGCDATLLHADLHYENVLASLPGSGRPPWLAIDPKPRAGHPGWELAPLLWNRVEELGTGSALRWSVRRRVEIVAEALGLDEAHARRWALLRATVEAIRGGLEEDHDQVTLAVSLTKALDG